jgi:hypothetical protein
MMKTLLLLAMLSVGPAAAGDYDKQAFLALMNQRVPGYDQLDATHQAGWNALFIHYMIGESQQYEQKKQNLIADWQLHNPDRQVENAIQYPSPLDNTAKQALIKALGQRPPTPDGGQKSLTQILQETSPILMSSLQPTPGASGSPSNGPADGANPSQTNTAAPLATAGLDPIDVPDAPANPGDAVHGGPQDNAFTGPAPGSRAGDTGPSGPGGSSSPSGAAGGGGSSARALSMPVQDGAPAGKLASAAGTKSMAALKNKDAFGPEKRDELDGAPPGRGPGRAGPRGPGAASNAYAGNPAAPAAAPGTQWQQSSGKRPVSVAFAARSAGIANSAPAGPRPRAAGTPSPGPQVAGGTTGSAAPSPNAELGTNTPSLTEATKVTGKKGAQDEPQELTEDEKKELTEIQQLLKEAADNGSLDPSTIEASLAKFLGGGQASLAMSELQSKIEDILRLSGSDLTMQEKQEVYALAGQLGLSDAVAEKLVAAVQHGRLPSPQTARRPMMRWQGFLLWLYGLWDNHRSLLLLGLALLGLICAAAANYLARDA